MPTTDQRVASSPRLTFGLFELDVKSGELWKAGYRVKLQMQPFKVLVVLLESAGEVVSREELQQRVWGPDVSVDFEHSLGGAIKKVREALGDSAENPRFIQTLARRGYRFIAPVGEIAVADTRKSENVPLASAEPVEESSLPAVIQAEPGATPPASLPLILEPQRRRFSFLAPSVAFCAGLALAATGLYLWSLQHPSRISVRRISQVTQEGQIYIPADPSLESLPGSATDGVHLFTSARENGKIVLKQVSTTTGESRTLLLPEEIPYPEVSALSPDGSRLLIRSHSDAALEEPLWIVPVDGGSAFRVSNIKVLDATWMPNGREILYASPNKLSIISLETGRVEPFAALPGRALWLRWSPDGQVLRFTLIDPTTHASNLWQFSRGDSAPHPLPLHWTESPKICCGVWTSKGNEFIFQATQDGHTDLWELKDASLSPIPVTDGPLDYEAPATGRGSDRVFVLGHDIRSNLEGYDATNAKFYPLPSFLANASRITYSRDRQWVAWTNMQGNLWRAHLDGSDQVRLSPDSMRVFLAVWSPDGQQLAMMARYPGQSWLIYTISASGGTPEPIDGPDRNIGDPSFSADGRFFVYGRVPDSMGQEVGSRPLKIRELSTGKTTEIANSIGYFSPRWSPDGRYIAALTLDQRQVGLYDVQNGTWKNLATNSAADPVWSSDSKALFVHAYMAEPDPVDRISIPDGKISAVVSLKLYSAGTPSAFSFAGLTPDNVPVVRVETSNGNLYSIGPDRQ